LVEIYICGKELMKTNGIAFNAEFWAFPNVCLEKFHSVVQWIMMLQNNLAIHIYVYVCVIMVLVTNLNTSVANPIPEVRSSGTVLCRILYPSALPDLPIRIRHWFILFRKNV
jgi:hypothetical protein